MKARHRKRAGPLQTVVDDIANRPIGMSPDDRRQLWRRLRSSNQERADNACLILENVYLQLVTSVANRCKKRADRLGLFINIEELIQAGRDGVVKEMREPTCRPGERFSLRVVRAAQKSIDTLIDTLLTERTHGRRECN